MTTAREVMVTELITVTEETPITESINLLMKHGISGLPVVDDKFHLVGIITEKDMLRVCHEEKGSLRVVGDLMTRQVRTFQQDDSFANLCDCLLANNFRRVPILAGDKLVGLVSRADLLPTILEIAAEQAP
jgi:CBS domain-containing protein